MIKYFRFSMDYILWDISYPNLVMLMATIPQYKKKGSAPDSDKKEDLEDLSSLDDIFKKIL